MASSEIWDPATGNLVHRHTADGQTGSEAEYEYVEHARHIGANRLSLGEKLVVFGALILLGIAALTVHLGGPLASPIDTQTVGAISESLPAVDFCREHSPYPDKSC